jgi:hypothetical protein
MKSPSHHPGTTTKYLLVAANNTGGAREIAQHTACIGQPDKDRPGSPIRSADAALVERLRQGKRESDGQKRADRSTSSLMALGLYCTDAAYRWSWLTPPGHPAAAMSLVETYRRVTM